MCFRNVKLSGYTRKVLQKETFFADRKLHSLKPSKAGGLHLKERICSLKEQILFFKICPNEKGYKFVHVRVISPECVAILLMTFFILYRFKMWTGLGRAPDTTISPAEMESERNRNYRTLEGQIDYFPNQIDRSVNQKNGFVFAILLTFNLLNIKTMYIDIYVLTFC